MLRIGVIGAGGRGRVSKLAHRPAEGSEIAAVCDPVVGIHEEYRKMSAGIGGYRDYREMLAKEKLDAVFITAPDFLHEEMTLAALEKGLAVYLEKPIAITLAGADSILAAAKRLQGRLFLGHNMRFFPMFRKMRAIVESGRIGKVQAVWCRHFIAYGGDAYFKDWHSERKYSTGLLLQKGAHDIDMIHYLAGSHTTRVVGMGMLSVYDKVEDRRAEGEVGDVTFRKRNWPPASQTKLSPRIDVEDHSMVLMQLASGAQASYEQCHYTPDSVRNYTVIGTQGRIENCGDSSTEEHESIIRIWDRRVGYLENGTESVSVAPLAGSHYGADPLIVDSFLRYVKDGVYEGATPVDARNAVAVGYLGTMSLRGGNVPFEVPGV